jgi:hypothetical protein
MATRTTRSNRRPPDAWGYVLYYANGRPTPDTWRRFLLQAPPLPLELPPGARLPDQVAGLRSCDELEEILRGFRGFLSRLAHFPTIRAAEASDVRTELNERAQGRFKEWLWAQGTGRLFPRIEPAGLTLERSLYAQLATAMTVAPFTVIKQCGREGCGRFFYRLGRRLLRFCSRSCSASAAKARTLKYRETHPDKYREYQRQLMAKRRREGKA